MLEINGANGFGKIEKFEMLGKKEMDSSSIFDVSTPPPKK